jgi:hypothetical protein
VLGPHDFGQDDGAIVCYSEAATGDAFLMWTYDQQALVVSAVNARGDNAALYQFFERVKAFISAGAPP